MGRKSKKKSKKDKKRKGALLESQLEDVVGGKVALDAVSMPMPEAIGGVGPETEPDLATPMPSVDPDVLAGKPRPIAPSIKLPPPGPLDVFTKSLPKGAVDAFSILHPEGDKISTGGIAHKGDEAFVASHPIEGLTRGIAQHLIATDSKSVAELMKQRTQALRKDVESWSDAGDTAASWLTWSKSRKAIRLETLDNILQQLEGDGAKDPTKVWRQLERLHGIEMDAHKIPFAEFLAHHLVSSMAGHFGIKSDQLSRMGKSGVVEHFGVASVSKDPTATSAHDAGMSDFERQLLPLALKEVRGKADSPLAELIKKHPKIAWEIMKERARTLRGGLSGGW